MRCFMLVPGIKVGRCRKMALSKFVGERMTRPVRIALLDIHIFIQVSARSAIALQGHRLACSGKDGGARKEEVVLDMYPGMRHTRYAQVP